MKAVLSIDLEILQPARVASADDLLALHATQIRRVSIRLIAEGEDAVGFTTETDDVRTALRSLVRLAQKSQPEGTLVMVWYQGRSESIVV